MNRAIPEANFSTCASTWEPVLVRVSADGTELTAGPSRRGRRYRMPAFFCRLALSLCPAACCACARHPQACRIYRPRNGGSRALVPLTLRMVSRIVYDPTRHSSLISCNYDSRESDGPPKNSTSEIDELLNLTLTVDESSALLRAAEAESVTLNDSGAA